MSEVSNYKKSMRKSFKQGLVLIGITVWFIPGIALQFFSFEPKNSDGVVNKLFQFSYNIAPDITSLSEIISIVPDQGASGLLTTGNIIAIVLIIVFALGCASISGASSQQDKLHKLKQEAREERMKAEL